SSFCPSPIRKTNAMPPQTPPVRTKLHTPESLDRQLAIWRSRGDEIVFTNGCFDILHAGHITYLEQAAGMGERLVIGVNDDASVARLKGASRPINALASRMYLLASLSFVDAVVAFSEDTPLDLIRRIRPDVLVKGGDYAPDTIVGAEDVPDWGGRVAVIPLVEGQSTTNLEQKILALQQHKTPPR